MTALDQWVQEQYRALPNYNFGWWLTTREHQDVATLVTAVQFLYGRFGKREGSLTGSDYDDLQRALGRGVPPQGAKTVLNRHLLLNMWRPLRLVERVQSTKINPLYLTDCGLELAQTTQPRGLLEGILSAMRFVDTEWTRPQVWTAYSGISVCPHHVLRTVLEGVDGFLTRQEYRLFIARMRHDNDSDISEAIGLIREFRNSSDSICAGLLALEQPLFPNVKSYQNWVDMDLHTFSLFALGTQFRRESTVLVLAGTAVDATLVNSFVLPEGSTPVQAVVPENLKRSVQRRVTLRTPPADSVLDTPPAPSIEINSGQEAEGYIVRMLESNGFEVRDFSRLRGLGFDLWARHSTTGSVYYCEVKSSTSLLGSINFTRLELEAAEKYRDRYVAFCVENFNISESAGEVWTIQDPWGNLPSIKVPNTITTFSSPRSEWRSSAVRLE